MRPTPGSGGLLQRQSISAPTSVPVAGGPDVYIADEKYLADAEEREGDYIVRLFFFGHIPFVVLFFSPSLGLSARAIILPFQCPCAHLVCLVGFMKARSFLSFP